MVGVYDAGLDTAVNLKSTYSDPNIGDADVWSVAARSSEGLDVEIQKVKVRQQLKETSDLNNELSAWIKDLQAQEDAEEISSDEFEDELGKKIKQEPELRKVVSSQNSNKEDEKKTSKVLEALDSNLDGEEEPEENYESQSYTGEQNEKGSIVGYWVAPKSSEKWSDQYKADGTIRSKTGRINEYFMGDDGVGYWIGDDGKKYCLYYYDDPDKMPEYYCCELSELVLRSIKDCRTQEAENLPMFPYKRAQL